MSSLYKLLRSNRVSIVDCSANQSRMRLVNDLIRRAKPPDCILVNAQSIVNDISDGQTVGEARASMDRLKALVPPFPNMWLEASFSQEEKFAIQIVREDLRIGEVPEALSQMRDRVGYAAVLALWGFGPGLIVGPLGVVACALDKAGDYLGLSLDSFLDGSANFDKEGDECRLFLLAGVALHALARINCKNIELRPILEAKKGPHKRRRIVPASIWHEIKITSVPQIRSTGAAISGGDKTEMRAHWIRGHYADYRRGSGLFGNPKLKGIFWIPEHKCGNAELGQVVPEYTIHP